MTFDYEAADGAEFYDTYLVEGSALPAGTVFSNGVMDIPKNENVRVMHNGTKQRFKTYHNLTIGQAYTIFPCSGNSAGVSSLGVGTTFIASTN